MACTLTFGEAAIAGLGSESYGTKSKNGFDLNDLTYISSKFNPEQTMLIDLRNMLPNSNIELAPAFILLIKNPYPDLLEKLEPIILKDQETYDSQGYLDGVLWNKKKYTYGRVVNAINRYNLTFDFIGAEAKIHTEMGGTIYNIGAIPPLEELYKRIATACNTRLYIEAMMYHDIISSHIGFHRDKERMKVIGYRMGHEFPLHYQWYCGTDPISEIFTINLDPGDMYVMSEYASGGKTMTKTRIYLKHAAGNNPFIFKGNPFYHG